MSTEPNKLCLCGERHDGIDNEPECPVHGRNEQPEQTGETSSELIAQGHRDAARVAGFYPFAKTSEATKSRSGFDYLVSFGGGAGPDVWEAEQEVSGVDIFDALAQARKFTEEGGWIFKIEQNDYPPTTREELERQRDAALAELETHKARDRERLAQIVNERADAQRELAAERKRRQEAEKERERAFIATGDATEAAEVLKDQLSALKAKLAQRRFTEETGKDLQVSAS